MDIEGGEYPWLMNIDEKQLDKFKQIVIEFHGIKDNWWGCDNNNKIKCLKKLSNTHYIIHAHGNNNSPVIDNIPNVIELTYINKKYFKTTPELNKTTLPVLNLDYPNDLKYKDINLNLYPFVNKQKIPYNLFQTWSTKNISKDLQKIIDTWKYFNPEYTYYLYDDNECKEFIKNNFDEKVYNVYCKIIPGAFKADLWRYCVLYIHGGVYVDIDTVCFEKINMFLNSSEASIEFMTPVDLNITPSEGTHNLFNCFIASVPKHEILKHCIDYIVHNVENNIIPSSILDFSGPGCLGKATNKYLNVDELTSFVGKEGIHNNFHFLKFEYGTEYVKDTNNNILFQNKNGNPDIQQIYNKECVNNISWLNNKPF